MRDFLADVINDMDSHDYAGGYIASTVKAVKSWLRFNLRPVGDIRLKIPRAGETPTVAHEMIPTKEELQMVLNSRSIRAKVAVAIAAFSAVRPEVLGRGDDGLRLGDIPDLEWDGGAKRTSFRAVPAPVRVRSSLSKTRNEYVTFLNAQGCGYLGQYLEARLREGEAFTPETAVLTMQYRSQVQLRPRGRGQGGQEAGGLHPHPARQGAAEVGHSRCWVRLTLAELDRFGLGDLQGLSQPVP